MGERRVLVTGGAGFVGSHLVDALLARGDRVRVYDNLDPQVHGPAPTKPVWLSPHAEFITGDVRDADRVGRALRDIDTVFHLAAAVGVGQSMYRIADYTATNTLGTAYLLQALVDRRQDLDRLVVASSMSIYGEGLHRRPDGCPPATTRRSVEQLHDHLWELRDPDGTTLLPCPTHEDKVLDPTSIYAINKADQERMVLQVGAAYGFPSVALRLFNIFGPRQALSNPYTGVVAIFCARLLNGQPPLVFEDGRQTRDFVSVHDVVDALLLTTERDGAVGRALNIGSGEAVSIETVARTLARILEVELEPRITGRHRVGDIRHCFADVSSAREHLGYRPAVDLESGLRELVGWLGEQETPADLIGGHAADLAARGLTR